MFVRFESSVASGGPTGPAGGDLSGSYPDPNARGFHETTGPTQLLYGSVPDLTYLKRSGLTVVGTDPNVDVKGPWSTVLYVDPTRGSDVTGTRGNDNRPFASIQAAINATQTNDTVLLAPRVFAITATITIPATIVSFDIVGTSALSTGSLGTQISSSTVDLFNLGANLGLSRLTFANVAFSAVGAGIAAIRADGSLYTVNTFLLNLDFNYCIILGDFVAQYARDITFRGGSQGAVVSWSIQDGRNCIFTNGADASLVAAFTYGYDLSHPLCSTTQALLQINVGSTVATTGTLTLTGQARLNVQIGAVIGGLTGSGLNTNAAPARVPSIVVLGAVGTIDFNGAGKELPDTATALTVQFIGAKLTGASAAFKVGGAAGNFQTANLNGAQCGFAATYTANAKIHMTARGATLMTPTYATPGADGDIVPPMLTGTVDVSAGGAVAKTWVQLGYAGLIRTGAACDTAFVSESAAASDPFVSAKTTVGLTITAAVVGGDTACNWLAIWK